MQCGVDQTFPGHCNKVDSSFRCGAHEGAGVICTNEIKVERREQQILETIFERAGPGTKKT